LGKAIYASSAVLIIITIFDHAIPTVLVSGLSIFPNIPYIAAHSLLLIAYLLRKNKMNIALFGPIIGLFLFLIYGLFSISWSSSPQAFPIKSIILSYSVLTTLLLYFSEPNNITIKNYISLVEIIAAIAVIVGLFEIITGIHLPVSRQYGTVDSFVATGWYWNRNNFSFFLSMTSAFYLVRMLYSNKLSKLIIRSIFFISVVWIHIQNNARAALLAVATITIAVVLVYVYRVLYNMDHIRPGQKPIFSFASIFFLIFVFFVFIFFQNPFQQSSSLWFRWQLQEASIRMLFETGGLGVGVDGFPAYVETLSIPPNHQMPAHNWLAVVIGEYGLFGLIVFLISYTSTLDRLFYVFLRDGDSTALALLSAMASFIFVGLGPSIPLTLQIHWIIWGIGLAYVYNSIYAHA
jgi:teichuronic acid biosynthesis protein TuaE